MSFNAKELRWYYEDVPGEKPADPDNKLIQTAEAYSLAQNFPSETVQTLGAGGEASPKVLGTPSYEGDLGLVLTGELMPMLLIHSVGDATMTTPTTTAWQAGTAYMEGDLVEHSDGIHMLWCQTGGTSGSSEPDVNSANEFDTVTDGSVTWVVRDNLVKYTGQRDDCISTFGIEMTFASGGCGGVTAEYIHERYGGLRINSIEFAKSGDDSGFRTTASIVGMSGDDDVTNPNYEDQGGMDDTLNKMFFGACDLQILIDDVPVTNTTAATATINRNITTDKGVNCGDNVTQVGVIEITGSLTCLMDIESYRRMANREVHKLSFVYTYKGDYTQIDFNQVQFDRVAPSVEPSRYVTFESAFSGFGTNTQPSIDYECITSLHYSH